MKMTEKEVLGIALDCVEKNKSQHYTLEFIFAKQSTFMDGYWDVGFKVLNDKGNEIDGPLLLAVEDENKEINSMDEVIAKNLNNPEIRINTKAIKSEIQGI